MCGISGYSSYTGSIASAREIEAMTRALEHRGPDDEGIALIDPESGRAFDLRTRDTAQGVALATPERRGGGGPKPHRIALGHRRFSIVDLSPAGHQPFWTADRSVCVSFNGEIYNYVELRRQLENLGHVFRTQSDTEVLACAYLEWGTAAFERFCGFWALALYDARRRQVLLARDRVGKAALYLAKLRGRIWWSSEIAGLAAGFGDALLTVRPQAVANFVVHAWRDDGDQTFYSEVESFPRASFAWLQADGSFSPQRYWAIPRQRLREEEITPEEAAGELRARLAEALRVRLRADVPVGIELSGGMDSSALLAIAASNGHDLNAFTIRYPGSGADEEPFARMVWERYKDRVAFNVCEMPTQDFFESEQSTLAAVRRMGEPFHSPSMLANQQIWRDMRAQGIRVSINGGAGDELFAGYSGVYFEPYLWELLRSGQFARYQHEATSCSEAPAKPFGKAWLGRLWRTAHFGLDLRRGATRAAGPWQRAVRAGLNEGLAPDERAPLRLDELLVEQMGDRQMNYWLRSGHHSHMGIPIEVRSPFLDHHVVEHAFQLPASYLIRDGWFKWLLRRATEDLLPDEIVWRASKRGFPFPFATWLRDSKPHFFSLVNGLASDLEVSGIDLARLRVQYDEMVRTDPRMLWRLMSVCLWKRSALDQPAYSAYRAYPASNECR